MVCLKNSYLGLPASRLGRTRIHALALLQGSLMHLAMLGCMWL